MVAKFLKYRTSKKFIREMVAFKDKYDDDSEDMMIAKN